jgi:hypothetical protein
MHGDNEGVEKCFPSGLSFNPHACKDVDTDVVYSISDNN